MRSERKNPTEEAPAAPSFKPALRRATPSEFSVLSAPFVFLFFVVFFYICRHGASRALEVDIARTGNSRHDQGLQLVHANTLSKVLRWFTLASQHAASSDAMQKLESSAVDCPTVLKIPARWGEW